MNIVGPAGNFEKLEATIKAGANEVYFGLKGFGARRNNDNFDITELCNAIDYAHSKGVKTLLTLNTIMKDNEIKSLTKHLSKLYEHGIDAVIVQDIGFIRFLKKNFPKLTLHGSTQMTVANYIEANYLKSIGLDRVVLARELSFEEIKEIRNNTEIELEIFVSGSLCISYSGNCYISSFIGGRSGNRGLCAYTCRKKFRDDKGEVSYILSPNDQLFLKEEINKLYSIGIDAIKVEGRKKQYEYVYETVSFYRDLLNGVYRKSESYKLFNRGYSKGYFYLDDKLMNKEYSSNFGYLLGEVINNNIKVNDEVILGDGIQYVDKNYNTISGIFVNKIIKNGSKINKANKDDIVNFGSIPKNTKYIYKNYSKDINDRINKELKIAKRYLSIDIILKIKKGNDIELTFTCYNLKKEKISIKIYGNKINEEAKNKINIDKIKEKISELGDTNFIAQDIIVEYDNISFVSFSELKSLKREATQLLYDKLVNSYRREEIIPEYINYKEQYNEEKKDIIISAKVRNELQANICRRLGINKIYYEQYDVAKQKNINKNIINNIDNLAANLYQIILAEKQKKKISVDWNLNIFNNYTIDTFADFDCVETIFLSTELSHKQIKQIYNNKVKKGLVVYGYLKTMYIEHTIFKDKYKEIQGDFYDRYKLVKNELGNIEVYLYKPMNLIPKLDIIEKFNIDEIRLDFTFETEKEVEKIINSIKNKTGEYNPYAFDMGVM